MGKSDVREPGVERFQSVDAPGVGGKNGEGRMIFFDRCQQDVHHGIVAARRQKRTLDGMDSLSGFSKAVRDAVLQPLIDEFDGKNPFAGDLGAGDFPRLDEQVNLFFVDVEIPGDFFGIHQFSGHGASPVGTVVS